MAKIMISISDPFLREVDKTAKDEHRSRSELIRNALRVYLGKVKEYKRPIDNPTVKESFGHLRSLRWKGKWDSTTLIRTMRDSRY